MNKRKIFTLYSALAFGATLTLSADANAQNMGKEYNDAMTEASEITGWDTDGDGTLDDHEFYVVNYRIWDTDDDSRLSKEE